MVIQLVEGRFGIPTLSNDLLQPDPSPTSGEQGHEVSDASVLEPSYLFFNKLFYRDFRGPGRRIPHRAHVR